MSTHGLYITYKWEKSSIITIQLTYKVYRGVMIKFEKKNVNYLLTYKAVTSRLDSWKISRQSAIPFTPKLTMITCQFQPPTFVNVQFFFSLIVWCCLKEHRNQDICYLRTPNLLAPQIFRRINDTNKTIKNVKEQFGTKTTSHWLQL
jgi:hypothetical protein